MPDILLDSDSTNWPVLDSDHQDAQAPLLFQTHRQRYAGHLLHIEESDGETQQGQGGREGDGYTRHLICTPNKLRFTKNGETLT